MAPGIGAAVKTCPSIACGRNRAIFIRAACPYTGIARVDSERGFVLLPAIGSATLQDGVRVCTAGKLISTHICAAAAIVEGDALICTSRRRGGRRQRDCPAGDEERAREPNTKPTGGFHRFGNASRG